MRCRALSASAALVTGLVTAVLVAAAPAARAASPLPALAAVAGPSDPRVVLDEDFENGVGDQPVLLDAYRGATGTAYAADPAWLRACNGVVLSWSAPQTAREAADCTRQVATNEFAYSRIRQLARALAPLGGQGAGTNHALAGYTDGEDPGAGRVELATTRPVALGGPATSRFLAARLDTASVNCEFGGARLRVLVAPAGGAEVPLGPALDSCGSGGTVVVPAPPGSGASDADVRVASHSTPAVLLDAATAGLVVRNANGSGMGNDTAFDNIRLLDVTPRLTTSFTPEVVATGETSRLTFTVTNTSELAEKRGWSFVDTLPAGLVVAPSPGLRNTCEDTTTGGATPGSGELQVQGTIDEGQRSCTISVDVVAGTSGRYTNAPGSGVHDLAGLVPPVAATLTVGAPSITLSASADLVLDRNADGLPGVGDQLAYRYVVRNTGPVRLTGVTVHDVLVAPAGPAVTVTCPSTTLAAGASMTCTSSRYAVTQADVDAGVVANRATASAVGPNDVPVISKPSSTRTETVWRKGISITKWAVLQETDGDQLADAGERIEYRFTVRNTGLVTLTGISVEDPALALLGLSATCPSTVLAPGETMTCVAPWYTVTQADIDQGRVRDVATSRGTAPDGADVLSRPYPLDTRTDWSTAYGAGRGAGAGSGDGSPYGAWGSAAAANQGPSALAYTGAGSTAALPWGAALVVLGGILSAVAASLRRPRRSE
jgi:uncharacterized repeat protein (TIGR01451 family)